MGLFDVFKPGKEKKPDPFSIWAGSTLPAASPEVRSRGGLIREPEEKKSDPFSIFAPPVQEKPHVPKPVQKEADPFSVWAPGAPAPRTMEEAMVPEGERGSLYRTEHPAYVPVSAPASIVRRVPLQSRDPYDPEEFAGRLPELFYLDAIFDEVRGIRSAASWRRAVEDSAHTGEPAEANLGAVNFESLFGISPDAAEDEEIDGRLSGMLTAAFEVVKPEEFPGWFQLKWDISNDGVELAYLEVKRRPGMGGFFDFWKKKKPESGLIPIVGPTLPAAPGSALPKKTDPFAIWAPGPGEAEAATAAPADPFAIWSPSETKALSPEKSSDPFSIWQPETQTQLPSEGARRGKPPGYGVVPHEEKEETPFDIWSPEAQAFEAERMKQAPLFEAMVPESERGSLYRTEKDPFAGFAPPAPASSPPSAEPPRPFETRRAAFRTESPNEVVRQGKKYYVPLTPREVADRMIEIYGEDGIRNIYNAIMGDRKMPEWEYRYYTYAYDRDNGHEADITPPIIILEHMSLHDDSGAYLPETEIMSELFNIPLDYLNSFLGSDDPDSDEYMEGYWELNQEVFWPLYTEILPKAWALIYPGLPGDIVIDPSEDDGCPEMKYIEVPPEDVHPTEEFVGRLEENLENIEIVGEADPGDFTREERRRLREWEKTFGTQEGKEEEEEEEEEFEEEEPEEEAPAPPPKKKNKGKRK